MQLHTLLFTSLLSTSFLLASANTPIKDTTTQIQDKEEGMKYIKILGRALKTQLQTHMKSDQTGLSAMGFCSAKAEDITKEVNMKLPKYALVRRTALKIRNENNTPDQVDIQVMEAYEKSISNNTFQPTDIKVIATGDRTRVYKPLVAQKACLKCHGSNISKEVQLLIETNYPKDKAVGFKEGSLRGVIVSEIKK